MFSRVRIKNFKSFKDSGHLKLSPINLLLGQNSSGKSSLIQSFLIIKQTLESPYSDEPVIINGSYCSLGDFSDVTNQSRTHKSDEFEFEFGLDYEQEKKMNLMEKFSYLVQNDIKFDGIDFDLRIGKPRDGQSIPTVLSSMIKGKVDSNEFGITIYKDDKLPSALKDDFLVDEKRHVLLNSGGVYSVKTTGLVQKVEAVMLNKFLPEIMFVQNEDRISQVSKEILSSLANLLLLKEPGAERLNNSQYSSRLIHLHRRAVKQNESQGVLFGDSNNLTHGSTLHLIETLLAEQNQIKEEFQEEINRWKAIVTLIERSELEEVTRILRMGIDQIEAAKKEKKELLVKRFWNIKLQGQPKLEFAYCIDALREAFRSLYYLGPLREEPKVFYKRLGANDPLYVGQRGENVAFILKYYGKRRIYTIMPPEAESKEWNPFDSNAIESQSLLFATIAWLKYIGVSKDISVSEMGKIGLTINTNVYGDKEVDLLNVGVGVSQVLPLIVMGLASSINSTLILEQPELHLHPFVQSRLADFFATLGASGKQVIAETHSEHLIQRMRYLVAKDFLDPEIDLNIYYTQRNNELETSEAVKVSIDKYGSIDNWPDGFCDETEKQLKAIMDAAFNRE